MPSGIPQYMYYAFYMDLPLSFFVFHLSLPTVENIDLVVPFHGIFFIVATWITEVLFKQFLILTAVLWADNKV